RAACRRCRPASTRQRSTAGAASCLFAATMWSIFSSSAVRPTWWSSRTSCARPPRCGRRLPPVRRPPPTRCRGRSRSAKTPCGRYSPRRRQRPSRPRGSRLRCAPPATRPEREPRVLGGEPRRREAPDAPPSPLPPPPPRPRRGPSPPPADPRAGLADELSRMPGAPEPAEPAPRRMPPRLQPAPPAAASATDAALKAPADQNLSEMAQRLEAALRRPGKREDARAAPPAPKAAGEPAPEGEVFTPPAPSPRPDMALRRPLKSDDTRAAPPAPPKTPAEPTAAPSDEAPAATPADPAKGARGKGP